MAYKTFVLSEEDGDASVDFADGQRDQHPVTALPLRYQGDIVDFTGRLDIFTVMFLIARDLDFLAYTGETGYQI